LRGLRYERICRDRSGHRAHLAPRVAELMRLRRVAAGLVAPDVIVRGGKVLTLHTGEILERDVVVSGRHIAAVTPVGHSPRQM
jgi:adenine deaminase